MKKYKNTIEALEEAYFGRSLEITGPYKYQPTPGDLVIRELLRINDACRELLDLMDKLDKKEEGK